MHNGGKPQRESIVINCPFYGTPPWLRNQWGQARPTSMDNRHTQEASPLFHRSLELLKTRVVSFCNDAAGVKWAKNKQELAYFDLGRDAQYSWICLELELDPESVKAQSELNRLTLTESCQQWSSDESEIVNEFCSQERAILYMA
jgi:hypothetical protein